MIILLLFFYLTELHEENNQHLGTSNPNNATIIQIYGDFFGNVFLPGIENGMESCNELNCRFVRPYQNVQFDAVMIHFNKVNSYLSEYPSVSLSKVLVLVSWESTLSTAPHLTNQRLTKHPLVTMTYRRDGDIFVPYGEREELEHPVEVDRTEISRRFGSRIPKALTIISNCHRTNTIRMDYIDSLSRSFPVDGYGECFGRKITDIHPFISAYMFFLSFENSFCEDYVTEKFWNPLAYGAIPVVFGGDDYSLGPPNSFIRVMDFQSPAQLASFLYNVSIDVNVYAKYFEWKARYHLIYDGLSKPNGCEVCNQVRRARGRHDLSPSKLAVLTDRKVCLPVDVQSQRYMQ